MKTVFGDLGLVMISTTSTNTQHDKSQVGTNKDDAKDAKV